MQVLERGERAKGRNNIKNNYKFPKFDEKQPTHPKSLKLQVGITKKSTTGHIIINLLKAKGKEKTFQVSREKPFIT